MPKMQTVSELLASSNNDRGYSAPTRIPLYIEPPDMTRVPDDEIQDKGKKSNLTYIDNVNPEFDIDNLFDLDRMLSID